MTSNQFTIGTEGAGTELLEFLKNVQPGARLTITIGNGVSTIDGELLVDEQTSDRLAARVKLNGGQSIGGGDDSEDDDEGSDDAENDDAAPAPIPKSGTGASAAAVLGLVK